MILVLLPPLNWHYCVQRAEISVNYLMFFCGDGRSDIAPSSANPVRKSSIMQQHEKPKINLNKLMEIGRKLL